MIRLRVILAIAGRNFRSYFSGILGYLFITVFCVASAVAAFLPAFFAANEANLDQLSHWFPLLLLFMVPAITMSTWADERRQGTDELLFTLPTNETEALLGKYLAVAGVYSAALAFSLVNVLILRYLGKPDFGLTVGVYFGFWVSGLALLSAGMLASALTANNTVAFVLGVVFCGVPIVGHRIVDLFESVAAIFGSQVAFSRLRTFLQYFSLPEQLRDFSLGVVSLSGLVYLAGFTIVMLYLNAIVINRRRWAASPFAMTGHYFIRVISVAAVAASLLLLSVLVPARADLTAERQFTLSKATWSTLQSLEDKKLPITIQAFISEEVPASHVDAKRQLVGLLRELKSRSGGMITLYETAVEPFSKEAETARALGIEPAHVSYINDGKREEADIFLGLAIQGPVDKAEIPFIDRAVPIEYEIVQALRSVTRAKKVTIGVLTTDANLISNPMAGGADWQIVTELRKQYRVISVNPSFPILTDADEKPEADADEEAENDEDTSVSSANGNRKKSPCDVLLAVMPSALNDQQMQNLVDYVKSGRPTLIFDDPLPVTWYGGRGLTMAPRIPKQSMGQGMPPEPKADNGQASSLMDVLDLKWQYDEVVFDTMNPHAEWQGAPPEFVFVSRSGNPQDAFNADSPITQSLQEVLGRFSGTVVARKRRENQTYTSLLKTGPRSGVLEWDAVTEQVAVNPFGPPVTALRQDVVRKQDAETHVLAMQVTNQSDKNPLNAIFCADIDMISDVFFEDRRSGGSGITFDNVTFVLNCVDVLAGDDSFIALRSRRETNRTLEYVERRTSDLRLRLGKVEEDARQKLKDRLEAAQKEQDAVIKELDERDDLDRESKMVQLQQKREELTRKLEAERKQLEDKLNADVRKAGLEMRQSIRRVENRVQLFSWILPAVLPICFGMLFLGIRSLWESSSISPNRRRN